MANPKKLIAKTQKAIDCFKAGQLDEAKALLIEVCKQKAPIDMAYSLLASIYFRQNDLVLAKKYYLETIRLNPKHGEAFNNLGVVYERSGDLNKAADCYHKAIKVKPDYANALFHLGNLYQTRGEADKAIEHYRKALDVNPDHLKSLNNLAIVLEREGEFDQSLDLLKHSLELKPNDVEALNNMGHTLRSMGRYEEAISYLTKAVDLQQDFAEAYNNLGMTYEKMEDADKAAQLYNEAIKRDPSNAAAMTNLGNIYDNKGEHERAISLYQSATKADESYAKAWNNLGLSLRNKGEWNKAETSLKKAHAIDARQAHTQFNLAAVQLGMGQFEQGWKNYALRQSVQESNLDVSSELLASDLSGKRILIEKDQGLGDELFFLRFAPEIKHRGAWIAYRPNPKIRSFIEQFPFINQILRPDETIDNIDITLSVGDLPLVTGMKDDDTPPLTVKLVANEQKIEKLKQQLSSFGPPPYIGLTWRGGQKVKRLLFKEIELSTFAEKLKTMEGTFIAIQRLPEPGEIEKLTEISGHTIHDLCFLNDDLDSMLALLTLLDDYIGVSNTNMHLRAAVGKTARVLVPHPPEWRWMASGKSSPWFPGFEVYRQEPDGDWNTALAELIE